VTPEKLKKARLMRANGASWGEVMAATGETIYALRCALEEGYRERKAMEVNASRLRHLKLQAAE
jgi:hypothetical protein